MTPALPHRRPAIIQPKQLPNLPHLRMTTCSLHAMHPRTLPILEQELAADLLEVSALEGFTTGLEALEDGLHAVDEHVGLHVLRLAAQVEGARHPQVVVELARGLGVDGERAAGGFGVHGD